ncbi:MAG: hypothetical protein ACI8S6_002687 [Myxococcota bacterium]|jgi:hypothetical protein
MSAGSVLLIKISEGYTMIWLLLSTAQAATLADLAAGELIISELHTSPGAVSTTRGQWFELYNDSGSEVDLDGLVVDDGGAQTFTVSGELLVAVGEYVVFATRAASAVNGGLPVVDYVYSTTDYSLPTGNEQLDISFDVVTFDSVSFGGAGFPDEYGASVSLAPAALDATSNDTGANWCPAVGTYGDGDFGSPGQANGDCPIDLSGLIGGDLVITEVMHTPSASAYNKGEWLEFYNASGAYIDLDGLVIESGVGESMTISGELLVRPGSYVVLAARDNPAVNGGLPIVDYRYIYGSELLLSDTDTIELSFGVTSFDDVSWNPIDYAGGAGISEQLNVGFTSAVDNDDSINWCAASAAYGDGDYGSPGAANTDCVLDSDGDGYDEDVDCDDDNAAVNPGAAEICDDIDNNCNSLIDDSPTDGTTYYADTDDDGYGDFGNPLDACARPSGYRTNSVDCNDTNGAINPAAAETCDGTDNNCSGDESDASDAAVWHPDSDADGYGDSGTETYACTQPFGHIADGTDCDDVNIAINPGAAETCDGTDDNCSGNEDDASDTTTYFADADNDKYGDPSTTQAACTRPSGYRTNNVDCDDANVAINPGAAETCDGTDDNCSGDESDASDAAAWHPDSDADGYGDSSTETYACTQPSGYLADATDCDDANVAINPGAAETCDGTDSNCSGNEDDASDATPYFADVDNDKYGDVGSTKAACDRPVGYRTNSLDCDDTDIAINPGEEEICNDAIDQDCDGHDYRTCDATLSAADGQITGEVASDMLGGMAAAIGDVDGDAEPDFALGAAIIDTVYVFDGGSSWAGESSAGSAAAILTGGGGDRAGADVGGGHDIDGDGYDDIIIGAMGISDNGTDAGGAYVVYGPLSGSIDLTTSAEATLLGDAAEDGAGRSTVLIGDVDSDGHADMLVTATGDGTNGVESGVAYLVLGPTTGGDLSTAAYATYTGDSARDNLGRMAAAVGDVDGDGSPDVMVNAYREDRTIEGNTDLNVGASYLLTSFTSGSQDIAAAAAATVFGENALDQTGAFLTGAGDVDGDGYDDVLIGSQYADPSGRTDAGEAYLMLGPISGEVSVADGQARFYGAAAGDAAGRSADGIGDIDGDGHGDVAIGAKMADEGASDAGAAYIVLGPMSGSVDLSLADTIFSGEAAGDRAGMSLVNIGDQDGGGQDDFLIGATLNSDSASDAGAAYIIFTERW